MSYSPVISNKKTQKTAKGYGIPMTTRVCIFCGGAPVTAEHVLPQWMLQVLRRDERGLPDKVPIVRRVSVLGEQAGISHFETNKLFTLQPKCVCASCNNGWMSEVENRAKPFLEPMVEGKRRVELDAEAQDAISSWACLKAITGHYAHQSFGPIATDWRKYFFDTRQPPNSWFIWVSAYYGNYPARFDSHHVSLVNPAPAPTAIAPTEHGILTSWVVGYLAVKVFGASQRHAWWTRSRYPAKNLAPFSPHPALASSYRHQ